MQSNTEKGFDHTERTAKGFCPEIVEEEEIIGIDLRQIVTELQSLGIREASGVSLRKGGAGPAEGGYVMIKDVVTAAPFAGQYVSTSPYTIREDRGVSCLYKNGQYVSDIGLIRRPIFYDYVTQRGVPYWKMALLHGLDCLATSVIQTCKWWSGDKRCRFCGIEISLRQGRTVAIKDPEELGKVAQKAKDLDSVSHVVLTTGACRSPLSEISSLSQCAKAIKKRTGLPIHAQCLPPKDPKSLEQLKEGGVDTVGVHIECFDQDVLQAVAPQKAYLGLQRYERAWKEAVRIFGVNQVSSFLIVGIGESDRSLVEGSERLADLGVFPFIVPLRPIPGSLMEHERPPSPERMRCLYEKIASILKRKGLSSRDSKAGCVRCGACSAICVYEEDKGDLVCHPCRTLEEMASAYELRRDVFVREQEMFTESDMDENDQKSTLLVAKKGDEVVGTVRVYPDDDNGNWVGGRLAVKKQYRSSGAGKMLVEEAVRYVKRKGCARFTAHIQEKNVPFFCKLGWKAVGPVESYFGRPHQLMEANLSLRED